jgi:hypothetical protein
MLTKLKTFISSVVMPTLFLIAVGSVINFVVQANLYFWIETPVIIHPFPYNLYFYFVLGLGTMAIIIHSKESN